MQNTPSTQWPSFLPSHKSADRFLPWVIGVMMFLCGLALATGFNLSRGLENWSGDLAGALSIQVIDAEADLKQEAILKLLKVTPGIKSARALSNAELEALLTPWLGDIALHHGSLSNLPIPKLIDIKLEKNAHLNLEQLREKIKTISPDSRLDDHEEWLAQLFTIARLAQFLFFSIAGLVMLSAVALVIFGCRAGLATHKDAIELMHLMGADDRIIVRVFERRYMIHGFIGGFGGMLMSMATLILLSGLARSLGQGLLGGLLPEGDIFLLLSLTPFVAGLTASLTARLTASRALQLLP